MYGAGNMRHRTGGMGKLVCPCFLRTSKLGSFLVALAPGTHYAPALIDGVVSVPCCDTGILPVKKHCLEGSATHAL